MKNIDDYLEEKEKILWKHEKIVNLLDLKVYFIGNFIIVFLVIFSSLLVLFSPNPSYLGVIIIFFLLMIIGFALLTIVTIKSNKERRKILQLPKEQLKKYIHYEVITNQRYIRRNHFLNHEKAKLDYSKIHSKAFTFLDHIIFIKFEMIKEVIINEVYFRISFILEFDEEGEDRYFNFDLHVRSSNEMNTIKETLISIIPKEKIKEINVI